MQFFWPEWLLWNEGKISELGALLQHKLQPPNPTIDVNSFSDHKNLFNSPLLRLMISYGEQFPCVNSLKLTRERHAGLCR